MFTVPELLIVFILDGVATEWVKVLVLAGLVVLSSTKGDSIGLLLGLSPVTGLGFAALLASALHSTGGAFVASTSAWQ